MHTIHFTLIKVSELKTTQLAYYFFINGFYLLQSLIAKKNHTLPAPSVHGLYMVFRYNHPVYATPLRCLGCV